MAARFSVRLTAEEARWLIAAGHWILTDPFARQELNDGQLEALRSGVRRLEAAAPPPAEPD